MVVENAEAPSECTNNDVMVTVKAASVQLVDAKICSGYGRLLRKILQRIYVKSSKSDLPVTLGRECSGVIVDVGANVSRLEVGDEVWLAVPFWCEGTLSQNVRVPEFRVGRKPKNVGYEGACSLPYAGTLALSVLRETQTTRENAADKRFLVMDGCSPVGCVLIQILKKWKASITTTCTKRAVPVAKALGAGDIIVFPENVPIDGKSVLNLELPQDRLNAFQKDLELRDKFDNIVLTKSYPLSKEKMQQLCTGKVVSTIPQMLRSDSCGVIGGFLMQSFIYLKAISEKVLGIPLNDYDEAHMCYMTLDELANMVDSGGLQTVVDKVLHPHDIEIALNHVQTYESIGSTVITFR